MCDASKKETLSKGTVSQRAQRPDITLVEAAVDGDAESFTELCRRYYPAMVAIAHSILGDRDLAEDAAQQAFAKAVVKLPAGLLLSVGTQQKICFAAQRGRPARWTSQR